MSRFIYLFEVLLVGEFGRIGLKIDGRCGEVRKIVVGELVVARLVQLLMRLHERLLELEWGVGREPCHAVVVLFSRGLRLRLAVVDRVVLLLLLVAVESGVFAFVSVVQLAAGVLID